MCVDLSKVISIGLKDGTRWELVSIEGLNFNQGIPSDYRVKTAYRGAGTYIVPRESVLFFEENSSVKKKTVA